MLLSYKLKIVIEALDSPFVSKLKIGESSVPTAACTKFLLKTVYVIRNSCTFC